MTLPDPTYLRELVQAAAALPPLRAHRARLDCLLEDYERGWRERGSALTVALVGATGAGKSTLLNALAGERIAEEGEDRPTSRAAVVYAPDDAHLDTLEAHGARVARYRARPGEGWSGQVFIDTPDINSVAREHRGVARALLEQADVALVVVHKGSVVEASQADFLAEIARRRRLLWVVNFADRLGGPAREELKAQVRALAQEWFGQRADEVLVFAVSALEARRGADPTGEMKDLLAALARLSETETADRIRRSNAAAVLSDIQDLVAAAHREVEAGLSLVKAELERGLAAVRPALREDFLARLRLAEGHLANEVRRHAAGRWWGPAAWWMRLSLLGGGGLAAATLVARRSAPAGLLLGAVSTALGHVQERTRARAAEQRVVRDDSAEDGDGRLAPQARAALAGARSAAHQVGLEPELAGLPEAAALLEALVELRAHAWRATEESAVAGAVAGWWRWARWLLLPVINLPLLALFGHVAYQVVRAYLFGPYLGADYFMNALALAVLLVVSGGMLASWSLAGATRRVRHEGLRRFEEALQQREAELLQVAGSALGPARRAAAELLAIEPWPGARAREHPARSS